MNSENNIEIILREKIFNFSTYIISKCNNEDHKKQIEERLNNLKFFEIMAFIYFLDENRIHSYTNDLLKSYDIEDTIEFRDKVKENLEYFVEIKKIIIEKK